MNWIYSVSCTRLRIPPKDATQSWSVLHERCEQRNSETTQQRNLSNASQGRQAAQKEHFAVMQYETASATRQPRGEHRGTIKGLQDCGRHYVTRTIHSPQSTSVRHGGTVASPMPENWPLFGKKNPKFGQIKKLHSHLCKLESFR